MNKVFKSFFVLFLLALLIIGGIIYDAYTNAPDRITIRYETITSEKVPSSFENTKIAFFGDLHYGRFTDTKRLEQIVTTINKSNPDIIVFLGDIFDDTTALSETAINEVSQAFSKLNAPLGKFSIYGDQDLANETLTSAANTVLATGGFENLTNRNIQLFNKSNRFVQLVAIENGVNGVIDYDQAYANVDASQHYVIAVTHTPDNFITLPKEKTDLVLAAHQQGSQIFLPFLGAYKEINGASRYQHGKYTIDGTTLDITNGVGTKDNNVRLFSPAQVVIYQFK